MRKCNEKISMKIEDSRGVYCEYFVCSVTLRIKVNWGRGIRRGPKGTEVALKREKGIR